MLEGDLAKCQASSSRNSNGDEDCHQRAYGVEVMHRRQLYSGKDSSKLLILIWKVK